MLHFFGAALHAVTTATEGAPVRPLPLGPDLFTVISERRAFRAMEEELEDMTAAANYWCREAHALRRQLNVATGGNAAAHQRIAELDGENGRLNAEGERLQWMIGKYRENLGAYEAGMFDLARDAERQQDDLEARCAGLREQVGLLRQALLDICPDHDFLQSTGDLDQDGKVVCYDEMIRDSVASQTLIRRRREAELRERRWAEEEAEAEKAAAAGSDAAAGTGAATEGD